MNGWAKEERNTGKRERERMEKATKQRSHDGSAYGRKGGRKKEGRIEAVKARANEENASFFPFVRTFRRMGHEASQLADIVCLHRRAIRGANFYAIVALDQPCLNLQIRCDEMVCARREREPFAIPKKMLTIFVVEICA